MGERIRYRSGYKYQLANDYRTQLAFVRPETDIVSEWIELTRDGLLWVKHGYAWDGPSGPTVDTKNFMRGSLVHDVLYQLIRDGWIERSWRDDADRELKRICLEDGMTPQRAGMVYWGVRVGGGPSCKGDGGKKLIEAP